MDGRVGVDRGEGTAVPVGVGTAAIVLEGVVVGVAVAFDAITGGRGFGDGVDTTEVTTAVDSGVADDLAVGWPTGSDEVCGSSCSVPSQALPRTITRTLTRTTVAV